MVRQEQEEDDEIYLTIFARLDRCEAPPCAARRARRHRLIRGVRIRRWIATRRRAMRARMRTLLVLARATLALSTRGMRRAGLACRSLPPASVADASAVVRAALARGAAAAQAVSGCSGDRKRVGHAPALAYRAGARAVRATVSTSFAVVGRAIAVGAAAGVEARAVAAAVCARAGALGMRTVHAAVAARPLHARMAAGVAVVRAPKTVAARAGAVGSVVLVGFGLVLLLVAPLDQSDHAETPAPATFPAGKEVAVADAGERLREVLAAAADPSLPEDRLLAIIVEVAGEQHDAATNALVSIVQRGSLVASMAGIRALRGRPCARVTAPLVQSLDDRDWQRRAWAAKVLGENRCVAAAPALKSRLARERDRRVSRQLAEALTALGERVAG